MNKNKNSLFFLVLVLAGMILMPVNVRADIYMKQKNHTDGITIMGHSQPARDEIVVTWMTKDKSRVDTGDNSSVIMRLDKGVIYQIDHRKMTYKERPLNIKQMIDENVAEKGEEAKEFAAMAQEMAEAFAESMEVKVTETPEKKKIGNWNCRKYLIKTSMAMGETSSEAWASEDLKIDWKNYLMLTNSMMAGSPGFEKMIEKIYTEMSKIKGVIVMQINTTKVMNSEVKSTTELLEFGDQNPPAGIYDLPSGYKKIK